MGTIAVSGCIIGEWWGGVKTLKGGLSFTTKRLLPLQNLDFSSGMLAQPKREDATTGQNIAKLVDLEASEGAFCSQFIRGPV